MNFQVSDGQWHHLLFFIEMRCSPLRHELLVKGRHHVGLCHDHLQTLIYAFLLFQGLYVFVVYFILHNQLCCPVKASYTVDMNGHAAPGSAFFTHGSGLPAAGGEISKSTQNLISAMEEVPVTLWSLPCVLEVYLEI